MMGALFIFVVILGMGGYFRAKVTGEGASLPLTGLLTKDALAQAMVTTKAYEGFPNELDLPIDGKSKRVILQYTFDPKLQEDMETAFKVYHPDYGAFVAIDASTGRVLAMVSHAEDKDMLEHLALRASFPSASVFKMVTASAAIAERHLTGDSLVSFDGRSHTLYKSQILKTAHNRWTRTITLKQAFAQSVNTVFGKLGAYTVGANQLRDYADRFGFNRKIAADFPIEEGKAAIADNPFSLAETASGYTRENTMSPMQGALMAAAIVNDGRMMEPFLIQSVHAMDGSSLYKAEPKLAGVSVDPTTAAEVRRMGSETVTRGTSRKSFRNFFRGKFADVDVGGKTGSLMGMSPPGKYDWFVGWAYRGDQKIAIAALTIHGKLWRVKSSFLARMAIEKYFKDKVQTDGKSARGARFAKASAR